MIKSSSTCSLPFLTHSKVSINAELPTAPRGRNFVQHTAVLTRTPGLRAPKMKRGNDGSRENHRGWCLRGRRWRARRPWDALSPQAAEKRGARGALSASTKQARPPRGLNKLSIKGHKGT